MSFDLRFAWPLDTSHPANLLLGRPASPVQDATGYLDITLLAAPVTFEGVLQYDNAVQRSDVIGAGCGWQAARPVAPAQLTAPHATTTAVPAARALPWRVASRMSAAARSPWSSGVPMRTSARAPWSVAARLAPRRTSSAWQPAIPVPARLAAPWQPATSVGSHRLDGWQVAYIIRPLATRLPWGAGLPLRLALRTSAGPAEALEAVLSRLPWGWGEPLPPGRSAIIATPPPEPWRCYTPPAGDAANLLFGREIPRTADILFRCRGGVAGAIVIPIRSTYIVINNVTLVRLPDNTALQAYSLSLKWDIDSWSVGWSASLPAAALDAVMPTGIGEPVELLATINETPVRLLAESIARDRRFGDARLNVGGRGRVAWLAAPYAPTVARAASSAMTSQQIAADAITDNGVPIGWGLNWQIPDWLVPAGVWSHQGSRIDAVRRIAEAAGGYVLGHRTDQTLHVRPRYPLLPWEWSAATPDLIIPAAVASTEAIAWSESPAYNRVFVAGQEQGRTGQITRAGTAGDILAPMVTDPLITHADAARARGASILAAGGRQATVTLRLPVLPETGILDLGQLIEYQDGSTARRGLVRAVAVDVGRPTVWQTVEIETHA